MLICIPDVLTRDQIEACRTLLAAADWEDGRTSAGRQSAGVKDNLQARPETSGAARQAQDIVLRALSGNALFLSAALPRTILPPMFNKYGVGQSFGVHVDNAIRIVPDTGAQMRADLSATLFLTDPEDYDGGELVVETSFGAQEIKLPAGHMVVYPASSLHRVMPITRGTRTGCFFWVQSIIRDDARRSMLFDLDQSVQDLSLQADANDPALVRLTGVYHNLVRLWGEL